MENIVIYGNGDFARLATYYLQFQYNIVAYCVEDKYKKELNFMGKPLVALEKLQEYYPPCKYKIFIAIGYRNINKLKEMIYDEIKEMGYTCVNYIHSSAIVAKNVALGENIFIFERVVVQPFVKIGNNTTIWSNSTICHDSKVGDHCFIASAVIVNGFVNIENNCFLGAGSIIRDNVMVSKKSLIGAGCCILENTCKESVFKFNGNIKICKKSQDINL